MVRIGSGSDLHSGAFPKSIMYRRSAVPLSVEMPGFVDALQFRHLPVWGTKAPSLLQIRGPTWEQALALGTHLTPHVMHSRGSQTWYSDSEWCKTTARAWQFDSGG